MSLQPEEDGPPAPKSDRGPTFVGRATRLTQRLRLGPPDPSPRVMVLVGVALVIAAVVSWLTLDIEAADVKWHLLVVSAVLVPISVALTAAEYRLIARSNGIAIGWQTAHKVTVVGTVANLLPLPGAVAVRINDLMSRRASPSRAAGATVAMGFLWLGWASLLTGFALLWTGSWLPALVMLTGGVAALIISILAAPTDRDAGFRPAEWLGVGSLIELGALATGAVRIWLTLAALGIDSAAVQALGLVAAGAIASTVGIVPGGLGVRELIAGALAPLVDLEVAAAIVAVALVRVVGLLVTAPIAAFLVRKADR